MEIFYCYNIDPKDNNNLDFEDLLKKALVMVRRKKFMADLQKYRETESVFKYAELQDKVSSISNTIEHFTYPALDLRRSQFQTIEETIPQVIPIVQIHISRVKEAPELI